MRWTKLKQLLEARFADDLQGRLRIDMTTCRRLQNEDGEKICSAAFPGYYRQSNAAAREVRPDQMLSPSEREKIDDTLAAQGIAPEWLLSRELFVSLSQSVDDMLASRHPLIRGLGMADARCGRRRLDRLNIEGEHPFVRKLHAIRAT